MVPKGIERFNRLVTSSVDSRSVVPRKLLAIVVVMASSPWRPKGKYSKRLGRADGDRMPGLFPTTRSESSKVETL
jgi:hypothetical protein